MATTNLPGNSQGSLPLPRIVRVRRRKGTSWRALMLVITQSKILLQASLFWSSLKSRTYNNPVSHHTKSKIIKREKFLLITNTESFSCRKVTFSLKVLERLHPLLKVLERLHPLLKVLKRLHPLREFLCCRLWGELPTGGDQSRGGGERRRLTEQRRNIF